uniref:Uncharacterized protein n=1 Tax=viral metagenome TaxID=1070528 RepID=A0A6C0C273_9ZZZZ
MNQAERTQKRTQNPHKIIELLQLIQRKRSFSGADVVTVLHHFEGGSALAISRGMESRVDAWVHLSSPIALVKLRNTAFFSSDVALQLELFQLSKANINTRDGFGKKDGKGTVKASCVFIYIFF